MPLVGSEDNLDVDGEVKFADWEGVRSVSSGRKRSAVSIESVRETRACTLDPVPKIYGLARA